jgi:hypothetical protein
VHCCTCAQKQMCVSCVPTHAEPYRNACKMRPIVHFSLKWEAA